MSVADIHLIILFIQHDVDLGYIKTTVLRSLHVGPIRNFSIIDRCQQISLPAAAHVVRDYKMLN